MTSSRIDAAVSDEGSVVLAVALGACLMMLLAVVAVVARWSVDHRIAQSAADLAALAAAQDMFVRGNNACHSAEEIAFANGTHVVACTVAPEVVSVTVVRVSVRGRSIRAEARAGY